MQLHLLEQSSVSRVSQELLAPTGGPYTYTPTERTHVVLIPRIAFLVPWLVTFFTPSYL